jgi:hypothetical protein
LNIVEHDEKAGDNKNGISGEDWKDDLANGAGSKKDCVELDIAPDVLAGMSEKEIKAAKKAKVKAAKSKRSETIKQFDRLTNRRHGIDFDAQQSLKIVKDYLNNYMNYNFTETTARLEVIHQYTVFRQLLEQIDRHDEESGDEEDMLNKMGMKTRKGENTDENDIIERIDQASLEDSTKEEDVVKPKGRRLISTAEVQARKSSTESDASNSVVKPKVGRTLINTAEFKTEKPEKPKVARALIDTNMFKQDTIHLTEDLTAKPKKSKKSKKNKRKRKRDYEDTASTTEEEEEDDEEDDDFTPDNIAPKYQSNDLFAPDIFNNPFKSSY